MTMANGSPRRALLLRRHLAWVPLSGLIALGGFTSRLWAAEPARPSFKLVYQRNPGAERCPTQEQIEQQVRSRLGYDPFSPSAASSVRASLGRGNQRLRANVELRDEHGKVTGVRELDSHTGDCDELAASVAFAISIAIDPLSGTRSPATAPSASHAASAAPTVSAGPASHAALATSAVPAASTESALPPSSASATSAPPAVASAPPRPETTTSPTRAAVQAYAGGFLAAGAAPGLTGGLALGAGVRWTRASLALEGRFQAPSTIEGAAGQRVSASVLSLSLAPCVHAGVLMACALGSFGVMQGEGTGVDTPRRARSPVADVGGRFGIETPLVAPLSLRVFGEATAHLSNVSLKLNGQTVWNSPALGGGGGLSLVASF